MSINPPLSILTQYPYSPRNGTIAEALGINANFAWVQSQVNTYMPSLVGTAVATLNSTQIVSPASSSIANTSSNATAAVNSASSQIAENLGPTAQATASAYVIAGFNGTPDPVLSIAAGSAVSWTITGPLSISDGTALTFLAPSGVASGTNQTVITTGQLFSLSASSSIPSGASITSIYDAAASKFLTAQSAGLNGILVVDASSTAKTSRQPSIAFANSSGWTITTSINSGVITYNFSLAGGGLIGGNPISGDNGQIGWDPP